MPAAHSYPPDNIADSGQLVIVLSDSWPAVSARMFCFEGSKEARSAAMAPFNAVVGAGGMAWDRRWCAGSDLIKKEGDCKAPAGVFRLVRAMGYAEAAPEFSTFPYEQIRETSQCVDDSSSEHYNRILDIGRQDNQVKKTWKSSELMKRKDDLYKWLIVVDYNREHPLPGAGSCIFIHLWRSRDKGTAGCTAIAEKDMIALLTWLKPERNPLLIQMPVQDYEQRRNTWGLPGLK